MDMEGPSEEELAILADWIEEGAEGPDGDMPIRRELKTPKFRLLPMRICQSPRLLALAMVHGMRTATFGAITLVNVASGESMGSCESQGQSQFTSIQW
ncbi:hypothetical protein [Rhodopirellula europaea]|uniref:hypothetical protein n=1 Tax=Rhodopirellula europaea TaxID=1263866 RepID=UPI003D28BBE1